MNPRIRDSELEKGSEVDFSKIQRFDERDVVFARAKLVEGTEEYKQYYELHPELEDPDKHFRVFMNWDTMRSAQEKSFPENPLAISFAYKAGMLLPILGSLVDGPVASKRIDADPIRMTKHLKGMARFLGADMVGVTELNQNYVYSHNGRWFYDGEKWGTPIHLPHRYVIVMGFAHQWEMLLAGRKPSLACHLDCRRIYTHMATVVIRMAAYIRDLGYPARGHHVLNYRIILPPVAIDAGLGEQCRIGIVLSKPYGPSQRFCTVTTDLPLIVDPPVNIGVEDFCRRCLKCAEACPSQAIPKGDKMLINGIRRWKIDEDRCFSYWNRKGTDCNICMAVCPWTKPRTLPHRIIAEMASCSSILRSFLVWADDLVYGKKPKAFPYPDWLEYPEEEGFKKKDSEVLPFFLRREI